MRYNLLLISDDTSLSDRIRTVLADDCTTVSVDPHNDDYLALSQRFPPHGVVVDCGAHLGTRTVLEFIVAVRAQFADTPLIVLGDEMSAQMVLTAFRGGGDEFLDRNASDVELHMTIVPSLAGYRVKGGRRATAVRFDVLSAAAADEDFDLAVNIASMVATEGRARRVILIDLSIPSSAAHLALGLKPGLTIESAIQEIRRLDEAFLESALAYSKEAGIHVLPLCEVERGGAAIPSVQDLFALLEIVGTAFDAIVIYWGAFSRQIPFAAKEGVVSRILIGCNQRFSSVRNAKLLLSGMVATGVDACNVTLAVHLMSPGMPPVIEDVARAVGAVRTLPMRASWEAMTRAYNQGRPLYLQGASPYVDALRAYLVEEGVVEKVTPASFNPFLHILQKVRAL